MSTGQIRKGRMEITVGDIHYRECTVLGRAAVGLYLALRIFCSKAEVLLPANICYAAAYPVLYAGRKLRFCDVDPLSGNVTATTVRAALTPEIGAAIIPHMYGQPVAELREIADLCRERQIFLIEDCASAMGAQTEGYTLGDTGDCTIYSTGYAKTLDLGIGGLLCSNTVSLEEVMQAEKTMIPLKNDTLREQAFFSRIYRFLRNEASGTRLEAEIYSLMPRVCRDSFLFSLAEDKKAYIVSQLSNLPKVIRQRREDAAEYACKFDGCGVEIYPFSKGAVPWRFNCLVEPKFRQRIITACLERGLPVSDWYPRITTMLGEKRVFPGALRHEERILNFPIPVEKKTIIRIAETIRTVQQEKYSKVQ